MSEWDNLRQSLQGADPTPPERPPRGSAPARGRRLPSRRVMAIAVFVFVAVPIAAALWWTGGYVGGIHRTPPGAPGSQVHQVRGHPQVIGNDLHMRGRGTTWVFRRSALVRGLADREGSTYDPENNEAIDTLIDAWRYRSRRRGAITVGYVVTRHGINIRAVGTGWAPDKLGDPPVEDTGQLPGAEGGSEHVIRGTIRYAVGMSMELAAEDGSRYQMSYEQHLAGTHKVMIDEGLDPSDAEVGARADEVWKSPVMAGGNRVEMRYVVTSFGTALTGLKLASSNDTSSNAAR